MAVNGCLDQIGAIGGTSMDSRLKGTFPNYTQRLCDSLVRNGLRSGICCYRYLMEHIDQETSHGLIKGKAKLVIGSNSRRYKAIRNMGAHCVKT